MFKKVIKEEFKAPADINNLGSMRDFITKVGRKYGVSEQIINAFKMAIDEAGTNIIRHAYRDWDGFITIRMLVRETSVIVSLIDQGHTFDPRNVKDPDLHRYVEIGKKGGLGIFIIRRMMDEIDYRKTVEGNELRLTKNREASGARVSIIPDMTFSMKTRFSLIASLVLTLLVVAGFGWQFFTQPQKGFDEHVRANIALARTVAQNSLDYLEDQETWELARIAAEVHRNHTPLLNEVLIVDSSGTIHGAMKTDLILESFELPANARKLQENVWQYRDDSGKVLAVYAPALPRSVENAAPLGGIYLFMDGDLLDQQMNQVKRRILLFGALSLGLGYLGIFLLVYLTMSPFKKLSLWVKALGRGEEATDDMEFDASDEIGEIAQAFNEITEKFRESQVNLAEQERLQKEMQVAQEIQQTLLPDSFPDIEGYEIASYYEAAKEVGGDYFDFVEVDSDSLGIVVADVSGKGVPGSLIMTMIRTALRTEARGNKNAADVLARVNDFVMNDMKRGMFVTVFYIILDSQNRTINYASAGHNPMILYRGGSQKSYYLNPRGFPIGINLPDNSLFRKSIESDTLKLQEGDVLFVYTDGITEAMNPDRDRFGDERFLSAIRKFGGLQVDPLVDKLHDEIRVFTEGYAQSDDITLVSIREKMKADDVLFNMRKQLIDLVKDEGQSVKEACEAVGVSTSTYYKYKKRFNKHGYDGLRDKVPRSEIEEKHISIEDKTKIMDIIKNNPDFGAKRISEELKAEKYGFVEIDDKRIYDELVRSRLNTKELRHAFMERGGRNKRMKTPGTPLLTLDGQVIVESVEDRKTRSSVLPMKQEPEKPIIERKVSQKPKEAPPVEAPVEASGKKDDSDELLDTFFGLSDVSDEEEAAPVKSPEMEMETTSLEMAGPEAAEAEEVLDAPEETVSELKETVPPAEETPGDESDFMDFFFDSDESEPKDGTKKDVGQTDQWKDEPEEVPSVAEETADSEEPKAGFNFPDVVNDFFQEEEYDFSSELDEEIDPTIHELVDSGEPKSEEEREVFDITEIFDEFITDMDETGASPHDAGPAGPRLEDILAVDEDGSFDKNDEDLEKTITSSIAGELMDEEMGRKKPAAQTPDAPMDEGFLDMMEDLGFDRREVLSQRRQEMGARKEEQSALDKKRYYEAGLWFYRQSLYEKAVGEFQKALKEDPDYVEASQSLGDAYFRMGRMNDALKMYEKVRYLDSSNVVVMENLGVIYANRGDFKKAVWQWGEVMKKCPERTDIIQRIKKMQAVIRKQYI